MTVRHAYTIAMLALGLACGPPRAPVTGGAGGDSAGEGAAAGDVDAARARSGIDWTRPPAPGPQPPFRAPAAEAFELGNGVRVVVVPNRRLPLVSVEVVIPGAGSAADPLGRAGLAGLTADLLDDGAGDYDALALTRALERLGARMTVGVTLDAAGVLMDTLTDTLAPSLAIVADVLARPKFAQADFDRLKGERLARIALRRDRPDSVAEMVLHRAIFGDHPYGWPALGMADTLGPVTLADARAFYAARYRPRGVTVVIAGDVDAETARAALGPTLGAWRPAPTEGRAPAAGTSSAAVPASQPRLILVHKPKAEQSVVWIGRRAMPRADPRYFTAAVANTILGGSFASRLNNRLREQLGYTYGASSHFWLNRQAGSWWVSTALQTKHTVAGVREALALIEGMRTADVAADELAKAAALRVGSMQRRLTTNAAIAAAFSTVVLHGWPLDWHRGYADAIAAVTASDVRTLARDLWAAETFAAVVVGDLDVVRAGLVDIFGAAVERTPDGALVE